MVDLPISCDAIGVKWIYRSKYDSDGNVKKHKARLVAKGHAQHCGVDYFEMFSPVSRFKIVRMFLSIASQMEWEVHKFDVKSTFLNGYLDEDVYVEQLKILSSKAMKTKCTN